MPSDSTPPESSQTLALRPYRIALLGCGHVGRGVLELLSRCSTENEERAGRPLQVDVVAVRDGTRQRELPEGLTPSVITDAGAACRNPDIDLVVELVGGVDKPLQWIHEALSRDKDVVTANKAVLAEHGEELFELARGRNRQLLFEASVAGALPVLQALHGGLPAGPIEGLSGILNGTCNALIGAMESGTSFEKALADAQAAGLAEADPSLDLTGLDAAHKLALLARTLSGQQVDLGTIRCHGIHGVTPADLAFGRRQGWVLKLLATYRRHLDGAALGVYPAWISKDSPLASVHDEYNAVSLEGPTFGTMLFVGKGAGGLPTAGSVVADIVRAARGEGTLPRAGGTLAMYDPFAAEARYSLRFLVRDRPGVLGRIAGALGSLGISIEAAEQPRCSGDPTVPIHIITHPVLAEQLDRALAEIAVSGVVASPTLRIRVEANGEES